MLITNQDSLRKYKKKYNLFETSEKIGNKMGDFLQELGRDVRLLEPSAGTGNLIKIAEKWCDFKPVIDYCEIQEDLCESLSVYNKVGTDFLLYNPGNIYDVIIMNPPYKNKSAIKHVDHAWDCLKGGGRIIVLVDIGSCEYLDNEYCGHVFHKEEIKKGFKETNLTTCLYLIHKPLY